MKPRFIIKSFSKVKSVNDRRTTVIWLLGLLVASSFSVMVAVADSLPVKVLRLRQISGGQKKNAPPARDPFNWSQKQIAELRERDPPVKTAIAAGLTLNAIIWEPHQALAVINGKITGVGDRIMLAGERRKQATILQIMIEKVIFEIDGAYHTLWLEPGSGLPSAPEKLPIRSPIGNQTKGTNRR
ncbi:MAG TPA: hypothetical protein DEQ20_07635 [Desulfobulbaceae bacterium]|nr:MAG: hypothetical protein A2520_03935 [Deltaproteobacteria bacterium RIFOXYD12_FULL_53_23]HCC54778.1 hypothetical protein [Desulfobulbaceae bacterium]